MLAKILCLSDMHKRWKDSESVRGLIDTQVQIQMDIINYIKSNGVTHVFILGDWYDRGFHGLGQAMGAIEMDRRLSEAVNGNVYLCIGNHFYLERDENPEMYIIQPNPLVQPSIPIPVPKEPIFRIATSLRIGMVETHFFHYSKVNKNYFAYRDPDVTYHIGVYHDECTVPNYIAEQEGYLGKATTTYMNTIYDNIDLALHGHIHTAVGQVSVPLNNGREVPLYIPGSMCVARNKANEKHMETTVPVIEIADDSTVTIQNATFSTHMDALRFYTPKRKKANPIIQDGMLDAKQLSQFASNNRLETLQDFMVRKGYTGTHFKVVNAAINGQLDLMSMSKILSEVETIE